MPRINRRTVIILHDLAMTALAWQLAWLARFNFSFPYLNWELSLQLLPVVIVVQGAFFWFFGLYRGLWRFSSLPDLWNIIKVSILGTLAIFLVLFFLLRLEGIPRSIPVLYPLFLVMLLGGPRLIYRLWKDHGFNPGAMTTGQKVLIIGAGRAGETLARDMLRDNYYCPVGFLDDNPALLGTRVHGLSVLGSADQLREIVADFGIQLIVIAIPAATGRQMQRIVEYCEKTSCQIRTLPGLQDLVDGKPGIGDLRDLSIEDLLGREKIDLDWTVIRGSTKGQVVMVSGGGGSIGAELCRQIAKISPALLIILDRSEFNLYRIQTEISGSYPDLDVQAILGDICDKPLLERVLKTWRPAVIYHAAAYKHVPLLEDQLREAVRNNIIGTENLAQAAVEYGCKKFILISTDKAVNPVNILGKTKRIAEILCAEHARISQTGFITVRFGNVLGSDGSVVPLFQNQIRSGGPVTVTHPDMQRYFMTISESCQLILQAGAMGQGGEIFVLDMGQPVRITYLAEQMIRLSGRVPGRDIHIRYTGIRPGEKLHEELFYKEESPANTGHPKILLARHHAVNEQQVEFTEIVQMLVKFCDTYDETRLSELLDILVPVKTPVDSSKVVPLKRTKAPI